MRARSLSFKIAANSLPRQLRMVIGRKFLGSKGLPLFLYIGLILQAFDTVWRVALWYKLLLNNINGKMYNVILNMYNDVKSCKGDRYSPCLTPISQEK
jgi:hypothetical protein